MIIFLFLAAVGLLLSCLAHLVTFLGINPQAVWPGFWVLDVGLFVACIPAVMVQHKPKVRTFWKEFWRTAPSWVKRMCGLFIAYVFFNFFFTISVLNKNGNPSEMDGKKVLQSHGHIIKELTAEEYQRHQAYTVRAFSGHSIFFYAAATALLYGYCRENPADEAPEETS